MVGTALARLCPPYALFMPITDSHSGARKARTRNLEIPDMVLAHHSGMTVFGRYFFSSGQSLVASGLAASSGAIVAICL
jgi:hypothetical protein